VKNDAPMAHSRTVPGSRAARVRGSALWAAWADALGFMTELTDVDGLRHRTGVTHVQTTMPWRRVIGGKFGASINLPAGCYSDDTQLRLATCRSIRSDGEFDLQAFAKIEVPGFLGYALGAGRGTKAAATNLSRAGVKWSGNTYEAKELRYGDGGGNGAAMRIQPHVWACQALQDPGAVLRDVLRNTVITHGHAAAIVGACWQALELAHALEVGAVTPDAWPSHRDVLKQLPALVQADAQLRMRWMPMWQQHTGRDIGEALNDGVRELFRLLDALPSTRVRDRAGGYANVLTVVGGLEASTRGSGTGTALAASWLAAAGGESPVDALRLAVNVLHSDTDTIATMAGALLGACDAGDPPGPLVDAPYISYEALRLAAIAAGDCTPPNFGYPDLLHLAMPKTAIDLVGVVDGELALAGLGWLSPLDEAKPSGSGPAVYQLMSRRVDETAVSGALRSGGEGAMSIELYGYSSVPAQTLLVKRREHPRPLPGALAPVGLRPAPRPKKPETEAPVRPSQKGSGAELDNSAARALDDAQRVEQMPIEWTEEPDQVRKPERDQALAGESRHDSATRPRRVSVEEALERCAREGYSSNVIGRAILALIEQEQGATLAGTFVGLLAARRR